MLSSSSVTIRVSDFKQDNKWNNIGMRKLEIFNSLGTLKSCESLAF